MQLDASLAQLTVSGRLRCPDTSACSGASIGFLLRPLLFQSLATQPFSAALRDRLLQRLPAHSAERRFLVRHIRLPAKRSGTVSDEKRSYYSPAALGILRYSSPALV